jgi:hypothetical protein
MSRSVDEVERQYPSVWRVEFVPAFPTALAAVPDTPEVTAVLVRLIEQVADCPEEVEPIPETGAHVVSTERVGSLPPLRLFYACDATTIFLLHVEEYDDLGDD